VLDSRRPGFDAEGPPRCRCGGPSLSFGSV
jgi:hypothetical protein